MLFLRSMTADRETLPNYCGEYGIFASVKSQFS